MRHEIRFDDEEVRLLRQKSPEEVQAYINDKLGIALGALDAMHWCPVCLNPKPCVTHQGRMEAVTCASCEGRGCVDCHNRGSIEWTHG